jgi:phosphoglycolate phosphatase-like HAD superfamily hydrolase
MEVSMPEPLPSWKSGVAKDSILSFVRQVVGDDGSPPVPVAERVAVFDNDGTLWCEKPMPVQLDFILRRLVEMAEQDETLRSRQPWQAAYDRDYGWLRTAVVEHYAGDDTKAMILAGGVLAAYDGITVEEFEVQAAAFLESAQHPRLGRRYRETSYVPMVELLDFLAANDFSNYIVSGGGRDFMRPISQDLYGVPRERVIGSATTLEYVGGEFGGTVIHKAKPDYLDDGPEKPVRIWSRTGRRPLFAAGNANGDIPMLDFTQHADRPTGAWAASGSTCFLRVRVVHDDAEREYAYVSGAEQALERAHKAGWTLASIKSDWTRVF